MSFYQKDWLHRDLHHSASRSAHPAQTQLRLALPAALHVRLHCQMVQVQWPWSRISTMSRQMMSWHQQHYFDWEQMVAQHGQLSSALPLQEAVPGGIQYALVCPE
mmetsp:Transcript_5464/g.13525  ORF Transcript_5464/g.13525 Transcript_5464/m.13525 type:complete len:105 (+) Transcript_5464:2402-2716(+)